MTDTKNPVTDAHNLVDTQMLRGLFSQRLQPEDGYSLELFRNTIHIGSLHPNQAQQGTQAKQYLLEGKNGDTLYRVKLGPIMQTVTGLLRTQEGYTREYAVTVEIQIMDLAVFLAIYRQGGDPLNLVILDIQEAIQEYAGYTPYEQIHVTNIQSKAKSALSRKPGELRAGLAIIRAFQPVLYEDTKYKPINLNPLLTMDGQITTWESYVRNYSLTVELLVNDPAEYRSLENAGTDPLERARVALDGELQRYARGQLYEDLSDLRLMQIVDHAFDQLSNRAVCGLRIARTHRFSLGEDTKYRPINLSPRLIMNGRHKTLEGYTRDYTLTIELQVTDQRQFLQLSREGTTPLELARTAIDGTLQSYIRENFYEDLSETRLIEAVEHAFDQHSSRVTESLKIVRAYSLSLGKDITYKPLNFSPLLNMKSQFTTQEGYVCNYETSVELFIKQRRLYQQLINEGVDPLERAKVAIDGSLKQYVLDRSYEELAASQLCDVIEHAFDSLSSQVTNTLQIVRAYNFILEEALDYINLGPRTLTFSSKIKTTDYRECAYDMTVELSVAHPTDFVRFTRQGNEPLKLVQTAIEGTIQRATAGKTHEELPAVNLYQAALDAFGAAKDNVIGGLKLVKAHKASLLPDARIQEERDIVHQAELEKTRRGQQSILEKYQSRLNFEEAEQDARQDALLTRILLDKEKMNYLFTLEKNDAMETQQFIKDFRQKYLERITEDLAAGVPPDQIEREITILLNNVPLSGHAQIAGEHDQFQPGQGYPNHELEAGKAQHALPQLSGASSSSPLQRLEIPEWGVTLQEIHLSPALSRLADNHQQAFQVWELTTEASAQNAPFQEADILIKISGQNVYTREALESVLRATQAAMQVKAMVIREGVRTAVTLSAFPASIITPE